MGTGIALLFHDRGTKGGEWSAVRPGRTLPRERTGTHFTGGWVGGKSSPHRDSVLDRPACSQSLYRLSYPAHMFLATTSYISLLVKSGGASATNCCTGASWEVCKHTAALKVLPAELSTQKVWISPAIWIPSSAENWTLQLYNDDTKMCHYIILTFPHRFGNRVTAWNRSFIRS